MFITKTSPTFWMRWSVPEMTVPEASRLGCLAGSVKISKISSAGASMRRLTVMDFSLMAYLLIDDADGFYVSHGRGRPFKRFCDGRSGRTPLRFLPRQ